MQEIPFGYCQCGCGQKTKLANKTRKDLGHIKGQPTRYLNHHNTKSGENSPNWQGGIAKIGGYKSVFAPTHARSNTNGRIKEHILIAEEVLGRPLPSGAVVHHYGTKLENRKLVICQDQSYHAFLHVRERALKACGNPDWRKCSICHQWDDPKNMTIVKCNRSAYHKKCKAEQIQLKRTGQIFTKGNHAKYNIVRD